MFRNFLRSPISARNIRCLPTVQRTQVIRTTCYKMKSVFTRPYQLFYFPTTSRAISLKIKIFLAPILHNSTITWKTNLKQIGEIISIKPPPVQELLVSFHLANASTSEFNLIRSPISVSTVTILFFIQRRLKYMAFIEESFSKINFITCLFSILLQFNSSSVRSRPAWTLFSNVRTQLLIITLLRGELVLNSILSCRDFRRNNPFRFNLEARVVYGFILYS